MRKARSGLQGSGLLFGVATFLSAFLLFVIQPILGKRLLPMFGGGASIWTTCLLFFQSVLVLGYLYCHLTTKYLSPKAQSLVHGALLLVSVSQLSITPDVGFSARPGTPIVAILKVLFETVGLPYFTLSTTGPLLQVWLGRDVDSASSVHSSEVDSASSVHASEVDSASSVHSSNVGFARPMEDGRTPSAAAAAEAEAAGAKTPSGRAPYGLYALSNLGALLALFGYPAWVEPTLGAGAQRKGFALGYAVFVALVAVLTLRAAKAQKVSSAEPRHDSHRSERHLGLEPTKNTPEKPQRLSTLAFWLLFSICPSILLLAMTRALSMDIAPMPLVWVAPLAAYLLSFVVCFGFPRVYSRKVWGGLFLSVLVLLVIFPPQDPHPMALWLRVTQYVATLFVFSVCAHGELFRLRPKGEDLTTFYLVLSLGGALGAIWVGVIAPVLFVLDFEVPIGVILLSAGLFAVYSRNSKAFAGPHGRLRVPFLIVIASALFALLSQDQMRQLQRGAFLGRSFYSSLRVTDRGSGEERLRSLSHGRTVHGEQFLDPAKRRLRTAYYGDLSGASIALYLGKPEGKRKVGVVGLGVGTLLSYGRKGDTFRVYEIDDLVVRFAKAHFTYWADSEADVSLALGDARVVLESEPNSGFDVLLVDAFSGDAIPTHLLTKEAFSLYKRHLAKGGILAVHTSNRYLDLASVVALSAAENEMDVVQIRNDANLELGVFDATWVLAFPQGDAVRDPTEGHKSETSRLQEMMLRHGENILAPKSLEVWTDDKNSLFPILE